MSKMRHHQHSRSPTRLMNARGAGWSSGKTWPAANLNAMRSEASSRLAALVRSKDFAASSAGRSRRSIKIDGEFKQAFDFGEDANGNGAAIDFSTLPAIAPCPVCKSGTVHDTGNAYQCSNTAKCKFRMGKTICQREVPREQVLKLIETGKTDLIPRFISKKGKPFSAFLKLDGDKVGFEFEVRKPPQRSPPRKLAPPRRRRNAFEAAMSLVESRVGEPAHTTKCESLRLSRALPRRLSTEAHLAE